MIDEKKLIDELKQSGMIADNDYGNAMVDMIESQPKINGWIPCSERLPDESGFYMVTKEIKETGNRFTGKSRFDIEKGWNDSLNFVDIVAWQPLPEEYHGKMD